MEPHIKEEILNPVNWEITPPEDKLYSSDYVIDAYLKGKKEGLEEYEKLIRNKFEHNYALSSKHASMILEKMKAEGFNPVSLHLKINNWDSFFILIVLPQAEFLSKRIIGIYDFLTSLEESESVDFYTLHTSICDISDDLNEDGLEADGFSLKYKM